LHRRGKFVELLAAVGDSGEEGNVEENWKRVEKVIKEVADETFGKEGNKCNKEWFDDECAKVIK
jgi:hypothetical protein